MIEVSGCIMFTDVVSSSKLWKNYGVEMIGATKTHENIITQITRKLGGMVVKTIGDAVMIYFDGIDNAITAALRIQTSLKHDPVKIGRERIMLRIGICSGKMFKTISHVQSHLLVDFYGQVVNTASRMEGEVSPIGGFALCLSKQLSQYSARLLNTYCFVDAINYSGHCQSSSGVRSSRLLRNVGVNSFSCRNQQDLHGVGKNMTLSCILK